ncbi:MAG: hypothetical protein NMNS02_28150 [Nitrosomonas sp.]|nr:MAG: hypothetical protein NMNS02_28150 [Nitrosomonas sp.]
MRRWWKRNPYYQAFCGMQESQLQEQNITYPTDSKLREVKSLQAVCDRGYRGKSEVNGTKIILPGKALKRDTRYHKDKKRKQCRKRAAIEPIIGHLKSDYRMARNYLKGAVGDRINLLMAACAWNLKQWLLAVSWNFFLAKKIDWRPSLLNDA